MSYRRKSAPRAQSSKVVRKNNKKPVLRDSGGLEELKHWFDEKGLKKAKVGAVLVSSFVLGVFWTIALVRLRNERRSSAVHEAAA